MTLQPADIARLSVSGVGPIRVCSYCGRIKNIDGTPGEKYEPAEGDIVSHCICDACFARVFAGIELEEEEENPR